MLQRLEAEDIFAYLQDENTVTTGPFFSMAVGGIKLMVAEVQAPRALELIEAWEQEFKQSGACPRCGSHNIDLVPLPPKPGNWLGSLFTALFGSYTLPTRGVYICADCGNRFEHLEDQPAS